jgi:hypothetical protein
MQINIVIKQLEFTSCKRLIVVSHISPIEWELIYVDEYHWWCHNRKLKETTGRQSEEQIKVQFEGGEERLRKKEKGIAGSPSDIQANTITLGDGWTHGCMGG